MLVVFGAGIDLDIAARITRQHPLSFPFWIELLAECTLLVALVRSARSIQRCVRSYALPGCPDPRPIYPLAITVGTCAFAGAFFAALFLGFLVGSSSEPVSKQLMLGATAGLALGSLLLLLLASLRIGRITRSLADALR